MASCSIQGSKIVIDIHTHVLPRTWPDWKEKFGYGGFIKLEHHEQCRARMLKDDGTFFREIEDSCYSSERRLKDCDRDGVHVQVLSTVPVMFSYWAEPEHCLEVCRFVNDDLAARCKEHPKRFVGLGTLPMHAPKLAVKELRRCIEELGLVGVEIGTHVGEWNLNAPELMPIFAEAEKLGACIFVHPWDMMGKEKMENYWLPWLVGMPAESSLAICSLIFGGVFERFPKLRFAIAHGGGSFPATIGRIEHGWKVRPDLCQVDNQRNPREYLGHFWVDSIQHDVKTTKYLVELLGKDRVCLGTDYPFPLGEVTDVGHPPGTCLKQAFADDPETLQRTMGLNALEWLGLSCDYFEGEQKK